MVRSFALLYVPHTTGNTSSYLGRRHHADGCDVPVGHREENHDDDVSDVGLEDDGELGAVLRTHVAHQEERDEGKAE